MVLCMWWVELVSFKHDALNGGSSDQRILFLSVWGSFRCPSPSVAQFGQEASSKKNPGCFKLLPLRVTETTCFCDPSMKPIFLNSSPDVWLDAILFLISTDCSFDPRAWFLPWYVLSADWPFTHSIEFATGYLHSKSSNTYKQYECSWAKVQLSQIRVWVLMQWNHVSFFYS